MGKAGIQIYTLRQLAKKDLYSAITLIRDAGYHGVEFDAGMLTRAKPVQLKGWMDEADLAVIGLTILLPELKQLIYPMVEYALQTQAEWLVMPWINHEDRENLVQYQHVAEQLNQAGQKAAEQGLRFAYHIHGYEFSMLGEKCGFDVLLEELDPNLVEIQVDTFWLASGGKDVVKFSENHIDRVGSFHLKDAATVSLKNDIEVGEGVLDLSNLVRLGIDHGIEWFIVEQEGTKLSQFESIQLSRVNLQKMLDQ